MFPINRRKYVSHISHRQKYRLILKSIKTVSKPTRAFVKNIHNITPNRQELFNLIEVPVLNDTPGNLHLTNIQNECKDALPKLAPVFDFSSSNTETSAFLNDNFSEEKNNVSFSDKNTDLGSALRSCFFKYNISQAAISDILKVLVNYGIKNLPTDARTFMKTQRNAISQITTGNGGQYTHLGIQGGLVKSIKSYFQTCPTEVKLNINIDGLPLTKSSSSQFWPILAAVHIQDCHTEPFPIGIFHGQNKPLDHNSFLEPFVTELVFLMNHGFHYEGTLINLGINAIVCDAPARAYICGIKGHSGYFSCPKCTIEGDFFENRVVFLDMNCNLRTNSSFRNRHQQEHHRVDTILERIDMDLVCQIPLDPMHLVYLGIMKRMLQFWVHGKINVRFNKQVFQEVDERILSLKQCIPREFSRLPRNLSEIDRWKATEFRLFLLYSGVVVLKGCLPTNMYNHFLSLSVSLRILSNREHFHLLDYAEQNLKYFVEKYSIIYGTQFMSYNVHCLIHLCDDVRKYGTVQNFSAFKFENYMYQIKQKLKTSGKPLQQIVNRLSEAPIIENLSLENERYPKAHFLKDDIKFIEFPNFGISCKVPNNCCILKDGTIVFINKIFQRNDTILMNYKYFTRKDNLFTVPCESSIIGIYLVLVQNLSSVEKTCEVTSISRKCLKFDYFEMSNAFAIIEFLHS